MKLKKVLSLLIISLIAFSAFSAPLGGSTLVGTPAATVNLIRNHAITNEELDQRVSEYQASGANISREQVLDVMINDEVFLQGAERDGIPIQHRLTEDDPVKAVYRLVCRGPDQPLGGKAHGCGIYHHNRAIPQPFALQIFPVRLIIGGGFALLMDDPGCVDIVCPFFGVRQQLIDLFQQIPVPGNKDHIRGIAITGIQTVDDPLDKSVAHRPGDFITEALPIAVISPASPLRNLLQQGLAGSVGKVFFPENTGLPDFFSTHCVGDFLSVKMGCRA